MRLRLDVQTSADRIPWAEVLRPGRGLSYGWLARTSPKLGRELHEQGLRQYRMTPFGYSAPVFPAARRQPDVYAAGGAGAVEFGSPLVAVVEAWAEALSGEQVIDWGGVAMRVRGVDLVEPPAFAAGYGLFRALTPVVMKGSGRDGTGVRKTRQAWVLPGEPEFAGYFVGNLRRKAEALDVDPDVTVERITWVGRKQSFAVGNGLKVGARCEVEVRGAPETLRVLWSWGLGQANSAGFGWVRA